MSPPEPRIEGAIEELMLLHRALFRESARRTEEEQPGIAVALDAIEKRMKLYDPDGTIRGQITARASSGSPLRDTGPRLVP